jgi:hypothetical protein
MRLRLVLSTVLALAIAAPLASCSSPYDAKAERLKKPKTKKKPEGEEPDAGPEGPVVAEDDQCRTNFFAEPTKRRDARGGRSLAGQADGLLLDADRNEGAQRANLIVDALSKLTNALKKDPYGPEPTYKMAVAYAMAGRRSCAIKLLDRLNTLQKHPDVEKEASRAVQRALRDPAFEAFRKDANAALGE